MHEMTVWVGATTRVWVRGCWFIVLKIEMIESEHGKEDDDGPGRDEERGRERRIPESP